MGINFLKALQKNSSDRDKNIKLANKRAHDKAFKKFTSDRHLRKNFEDLAYLSFESFSSILDIGCGNGAVLINIASGMQNGKKVKLVGVDISFESLKYCRHNAEQNGVKAHFIVADIENLPFKNDMFDLIIGKDILHHSPNNRRIFQEANTRLVNDGFFVFMEPTFLIDVVSEVACTLIWWLPRSVRFLLGKSNKRKIINEIGEYPHVLPLRCKALENLARETGFSVIKKSYAGNFFIKIVDDIFKPIELRLKINFFDFIITKIKNLSKALDNMLSEKHGILSTMRSQVVFCLKK